MADQAGAPPPKKQKVDGNLSHVDRSILLAAQDPEQWIASRRRNWPTKERIAQRKAEAEKQRQAQQAQQTEAPQTEAPDAASAPAGAGAQRVAALAPRKPPICRYFLRGRCTAGDKCRFSHEKPNQARDARPAHERVYRRFEPPTKASLFVKLVQTDHDAEDEKLLDFIDYLYQKQLI